MGALRWLHEEPKSDVFLFFYLFSIFIILALFRLLGRKSACRVKLRPEKSSYNEPTGARKTTINPCSSGLEPTTD